jgi:hypothetical protein
MTYGIDNFARVSTWRFGTMMVKVSTELVYVMWPMVNMFQIVCNGAAVCFKM